MNQRELELLIEAATASHRERDSDGHIVPSAAWWDLSPEGRDELFSKQALAREIERAIDPSGWSTTTRAVMAAIPEPSRPREPKPG